jgi:hypothetical protein
MGADGGLAFIPIKSIELYREAVECLRPFFRLEAKGSDWGDDSRSDWVQANGDDQTAIIVPYGTEVDFDDLMGHEIMYFIKFLRRVPQEIGINYPTFGDIVLDFNTRPTWDAVDRKDRHFYSAIIKAEEMYETYVSHWLENIEKYFWFVNNTFHGSEIPVAFVQTWT